MFFGMLVSALLVLCFLTGAALFDRYGGAESAWPANMLTNFHPHFAAATLSLFAMALVTRRRLAATLAVALFVANSGQTLAFPQATEPGATTAVASGPTVRVMSINLLFSNENITGLRTSVEEANPDILLIQEANWRWAERLAELAAAYPYWVKLANVWSMPDQHGTMVFSRYPLVKREQPMLGGMPGRLSAASVQVGERRIRVASVHLVKPLGTEGLALQQRQLADLQVWLRGSDQPVILGGDFNATLSTPQLERLIEAVGLMTDRQSAPWWQAADGTYPAWLPALRLKIDHILTRGATIATAATAHVAGSDHLAVVADVLLRSKPPLRGKPRAKPTS